MASSSSYSNVKLGKLKFKGEKHRTSSDGVAKKRKRAADDAAAVSQSPSNVDALVHGGWWCATDMSDVRGGGTVAIECYAQPSCYMAAMDNGKFTVGPPHDKGDGPAPEEILSCIRTPDCQWIALKTGFGKYVGVDSSAKLVATAEAVGPREKWDVVFQDGKAALQAVSTNLFLSFNTDSEGYVFAACKTAGINEMINFRTNMEREKPIDDLPVEDHKKAKDCETAYFKMYQHSKIRVHGKLMINELGSTADIKKAKEVGNLHETLLDRRMKTKSDKYC